MALKYLIREVVINKKFARTQQVSWADRKKLIFDMMNEVMSNNLFLQAEKNDPRYNLMQSSTTTSLGMYYQLEPAKTIAKQSLLSGDEMTLTGNNITAQNFLTHSFAYLFHLALIKHNDMVLFQDGTEHTLFEYLGQGDNAGHVYKTIFGIIVSERLKKIFIIKQSDNDSLSYVELLHYLSKKSSSFAANLANNCFKPVAIPLDGRFDPEEVSSVNEMEIGVNSDLIEEYKMKAGQTDAFYTIVFAPFSKFFGTGREVKFTVKFSEDGDVDARKLFEEIYGSFEEVQGEQIERMFTKFKLTYEKTDGTPVNVNFKKNKTVDYTPQEDHPSAEHISEAFRWVTDKLTTPQQPDPERGAQ